ncbi:hypothetical protein CFE70_005126 [Pyrenophora teres f. teres 0-1]
MPYNPFTTEAWTEYGVGILILLARITARCSRIGLKWEGDDYFALLSVFFFTGELVMLQMIGVLGSITGMTDEKALTLTPEEARNIVVGSKCLLAGWIIYTTLIWCLNITGGICVVAYIATITVYLTHCHPINRLWQVYPYPGNDCALNISKYLALVVTNVTTDAMILYIPLPLLWNVQLPIRKKVIYGFWLCTGIFIMTATLLRCILCLQDVSQINVGTIWSIRETFVGIIAVNFPVLKPFFSKAKNAVSSAKASKDSSSNNAVPIHLRLLHVDRKGKKRTVHEITGMDTEMNESEEYIVRGAASEGRTESETNVRA